MTGSGILVRTDASATLGTGHSMRCLALAQLCRDLGVPVALAYAESTASQRGRWKTEVCSVTPITALPGSAADADITAGLSRQLGCDWVVIDGYLFGAAYQRQLKTHGCQVLCVDDYVHTDHYYADVVLNQNAYADAERYNAREPDTRLLMGPRYALLRREFLHRAHDRRRSIPRNASRILATLGGGDPRNATAKVIDSLQRLGAVPLLVRVVVGGSHSRGESMESSSTSSRCPIEIIHDATNLADLMSWSDLAISGAGVTALELAFMGVPILTLVIAGNQLRAAESLDRHHVAMNLGPVESVGIDELATAVVRLANDHERRLRMSEAGQRLVDGYGAYRVLQSLGLATLRLARATERDSRVLWEWANEREVRRFSFHSDPIPWETHLQWFARKLSDPRSSIWIAYDADDEPVGQIRCDCTDDRELYVAVSVSLNRRGNGYGRKLIEEGLKQASKVFPGRRAHALIKHDNAASIRAFHRAGFTLAGEKTIEGHRALHYVRQPPLSEFA